MRSLTRQRGSDEGADTLKADHQPEGAAQLLLAQDVHQNHRLLRHVRPRQHPIEAEQHSKLHEIRHVGSNERQACDDEDDAVVDDGSEGPHTLDVQHKAG